MDLLRTLDPARAAVAAALPAGAVAPYASVPAGLLASPDAVAGLVSRPVTPAMVDYGCVRDIYRRSFPPRERTPLWLLSLMSLRDCVDFVAFYDPEAPASQAAPCALAYTVTTNRLVYLLYLAVDRRYRSNGFGSRAIAWIKARHPRRPIALGVEPVYPFAPNIEQRRRRIAFYEKNGFRETGYAYCEAGDLYSVMFHGWVFEPNDLRDALQMFSLGLYRADVVCMGDEGRQGVEA